jgi:hypothetical protein
LLVKYASLINLLASRFLDRVRDNHKREEDLLMPTKVSQMLFSIFSRCFLNENSEIVNKIADEVISFLSHYISIPEQEEQKFKNCARKIVVECIDLLSIRPSLYYPRPTVTWFEQGQPLNDNYVEYMRKGGKEKQLVRDIFLGLINLYKYLLKILVCSKRR